MTREYQHVQFLDLYGNGLMEEVVVIKEEVNGDKYFIQTHGLDLVDLERLRTIIDRRDSNLYPLWDLMSQTMLRNGMNALEYFDQLVRVKTAAGPIINRPRSGTGVVQVRVPVNPQAARKVGRPAKSE
jgi:hypothetical protein